MGLGYWSFGSEAQNTPKTDLGRSNHNFTCQPVAFQVCHQSTCIGGYEVTVVALSACMAEMTEHTSAPDMECLDLLSYQSVAQALSALTVATMMVGFGPERGRGED